MLKICRLGAPRILSDPLDALELPTTHSLRAWYNRLEIVAGFITKPVKTNALGAKINRLGACCCDS